MHARLRELRLRRALLSGCDELRDFLRPRTRHNQHVPADRRRLLHFRRATAVLAILEAG